MDRRTSCPRNRWAGRSLIGDQVLSLRVHGADHRVPSPPEILGRDARPRARGLPPPRGGQVRPRRPERLGEEHPVPAPRGRDDARPGRPRAQARPPVRLPPAGPERPAGDRRAGRPLGPEPGGAADRRRPGRPRGVDGPPGRLGRGGRERAHGPRRIPPRLPGPRPQPGSDRLRTLEYVVNYTDYRVQRDAIARAREAQRHRHQAELKRQLAIIEEFKSRKVYEQVLSRKLRVEQMRRETPELPPTTPRAFRLSFRTGASGPGVVRLEGVAKSHGGRLLFADVDLELAKGDKVGLVGPNGAGKTTLLEVLIGRQEADAGSVFRGKNLKIGYFAQEAEELDFSRTLLEEISSVRHPPPPESWARGLLGRFWFRGDAVHSRVGQLSGGERARLALAKFIAQDYDLLVLDEPTNHLDIESQEIVATALQTYPGMLLVVSHNRSFLNEVANKIAVIAHQRLAVFQGTFKDSWAAAKMAEFMAVQQRPRYRVLRVVKDWETGTAYHGGDVIALNGAETQAFLRLLRWAEANGRVERIET